MSDISHKFGADLVISPSGDLAQAPDDQLGHQRVLRRLLTNPGDYIWSPSYGAGLARYIGMPNSVTGIQAAIRSQIFREATVARSPEPSVTVTEVMPGTLDCAITYADAATGQTRLLGFTIGRA